MDAVEVFSRTARDNRVGCMFVRCAPSSGYTQLFSHGNAVDLGQTSGKPSEKNLYADIDAAGQALRTRYGVSPENIILYGQSIGTVPTVHLASRYECAAVNSPFASDAWIACGFIRYQENIVL
ncbi:hypothetical protein J1605_013596 [Eschrichtius robustus]|uniref:Alpha/beta hydrolase domain-containing protein 17C n=1 Tax=Eschrichtius robustus TaxID=9764 RepID=A0AB34GFI1_ESCRO|nr:hypothetical protein J1605_013596 [Eschrichtius robustus]